MLQSSEISTAGRSSRHGASGDDHSAPKLSGYLVIAISVCLLVFGTTTPAVGQFYPDTLWVRTYDSPGDSSDIGMAVWLQPGGNIFTGVRTGYAAAMGAIRWNYAGDTAWTTSFAGLQYRGFAPCKDGGGAGVGQYLDDFGAFKFDSLGNQLWFRTFDGSGTGVDDPTAVVCDDSGYVAVTGLTSHATLGTTVTTIRYTPDGDTSWVRYFDVPVKPSAIRADTARNLYVAARRYLVKYDTNGDTVWVADYGSSAMGPVNDMELDAAGNIYLCASIFSGSDNWLIMKYTPSGDTVWTARYDGAAHDQDIPLAIAVDAEGQVYVTGFEDLVNYPDRGLTTAKFTADGDTAWVHTYGSPNPPPYSYPHDIALGPDGSVYVTGGSGPHGLMTDILTIKYSPMGTPLWSTLYDGAGTGYDLGYGIAVDDSGAIFVTGVTQDSLGGYECILLRYAEFAMTVPYNLTFYLYSPVDMVVTDPLGDSIGIDFNTILAGSDYDVDTDFNSDGDPDDIVTIPTPWAGDYIVRIIREPGVPDSAKFTLSIRIDGNTMLYPDDYQDQPVSALGTTIPDTYVYTTATTLCGDCNANGSITSADIIYLVTYVFKGGPPPVVPGHGDVNCNGAVTSSDIIYLVTYVFKGGDPPCSHSVGD